MDDDFLFNFDFDIVDDDNVHVINNNVDVNTFLNQLTTTTTMSVPCEVSVTNNPGVVEVQTQQQELDFLNTWGSTQTSDNGCGGRSNDGIPEPEEISRPKRGRPRSKNPKNPQNTERLRQQRIKDKKKKLTFQQELEALRREVEELERDEALMSKLIGEAHNNYLEMIGTGELVLTNIC